jgi:hypothetical protein
VSGCNTQNRTRFEAKNRLDETISVRRESRDARKARTGTTSSSTRLCPKAE